MHRRKLHFTSLLSLPHKALNLMKIGTAEPKAERLPNGAEHASRKLALSWHYPIVVTSSDVRAAFNRLLELGKLALATSRRPAIPMEFETGISETGRSQFNWAGSRLLKPHLARSLYRNHHCFFEQCTCAVRELSFKHYSFHRVKWYW